MILTGEVLQQIFLAHCRLSVLVFIDLVGFEKKDGARSRLKCFADPSFELTVTDSYGVLPRND